MVVAVVVVAVVAVVGARLAVSITKCAGVPAAMFRLRCSDRGPRGCSGFRLSRAGPSVACSGSRTPAVFRSCPGASRCSGRFPVGFVVSAARSRHA